MAHTLMSTRWWHRALVVASAILVVLPVAGRPSAGAPSAAAPSAGVPSGAAPLTAVQAGAVPAGVDTFVTRSGSQLLLDGSAFRFGGANIYWLGLDENVGGVDYPTYFRIDDALRTAKAMGATVVRSHTLGISTGTPLSFEPTLGTFNPKAFATIDYAVAAARRLGIRLVVPLVDNWAYYHGGRRDFTNWFGLPAEAFYTDPRVVAAFQDYIRNLLAHVNPYTGRAYGAEPTVLAWELGNELDGMTPQWVDTVSSYLHQLAPRHLVAAPGVSPATLTSPHVDIVDAHYYPPTAERVLADAARVTDAGKVYLAGEYGSPAASTELLAPLAADRRVAGTLFWSLFGRNDTHGYVEHADGFTLHHPGDTPAMRRAVQAIEQFNRAVNPQADVPAVPLGQPLLTTVTHSHGETVLAWRGTAAAVGYTVQRSRWGARGPWSTVSSLVSDRDTPWIDTRSSTSPAWYRVVAQDAAGRRRVSEPVHSDPRTGVLVDPLSSWRSTAAHSDNLVVRPDGDRVTVAPAAGTSPPGRPQITWSHLLTTGFEVGVTAPAGAAAPSVLISYDGHRFTRAVPRRTVSGPGRYRLSLERLQGVRSVRVEWPARGAGAVRVTGAVLRYAEPVIDDELIDFSETVQHTPGFTFETGNAGQFGGDASRITRTGGGAGSLVWRLRGMTAATVTAYVRPRPAGTGLRFATSTDGRNWRSAAPETAGTPAGDWTRQEHTLAALRAEYLRIDWPAAPAPATPARLARVALHGSPRPVSPPSPFAQLLPAAGATAVLLSPRLVWGPAARAGHYTLVLSTRPDLSEPLLTVRGLRDTGYSLTERLQPGTRYYWAVTATNVAGSRLASGAPASFTTFDPATMPLPVEDFSGYDGSDELLRAAYVRNTGGDPITVSLDDTPADVAPAMAVSYTLGTAGYAGVSRTFATPQDWSADRGLSFWLQPDGTGRPVTVQFQAAGVTWETAVTPTGTAARVVRLPFEQFRIPPWAQPGPLELSQVSQLSLYVGGPPGAGTFYVDSFAAYPI